MDDFGKIQLHPTADDTVVIIFGLKFHIFLQVVLGSL